MRLDRSEKSTIPEISPLGSWNLNEWNTGRNQYQIPTTLMSRQTTDGPMPQYQAEKTIAAQAVR